MQGHTTSLAASYHPVEAYLQHDYGGAEASEPYTLSHNEAELLGPHMNDFDIAAAIKFDPWQEGGVRNLNSDEEQERSQL